MVLHAQLGTALWNGNNLLSKQKNYMYNWKVMLPIHPDFLLKSS